MNQYQGQGQGQGQGDPSGFRQLIINSIVTKNKMDALGNIRGRGKDPTTRGLEMQSVFQEFAQMDPTTLGSMTVSNAFGNARRSMFGYGGRSRKKRKTRRR